MARNIIYFINPISGTRGKEKVLDLIEKETRRNNIPFQVMHTNAAGNYDFLKSKIAKEQITDIVICGGDGTVSQVTSVLIDEPVNIGIIPMGSGNGLALAAKIPARAEKALQLIFDGTPAYIDSFLINSSFSCMLCGLGFDAQVAHDFSKQKKRGLVNYIRLTVRNFFNAKPYNFEIVNKGEKIAVSAYFISVANSNQFGNQVTIAPQASLCDGLLDIVVVKKMSKLKLVKAVVKQLTSGKIAEYNEETFHKKEVLYFQTPKLVIHNNFNAPLHIDGDPAATSGKFVIQIIPRAFRLIQPK